MASTLEKYYSLKKKYIKLVESYKELKYLFLKRKHKYYGGEENNSIPQENVEFELDFFLLDSSFLELYKLDKTKIHNILRNSRIKKCIIRQDKFFSDHFLKYFLKYMVSKIYVKNLISKFDHSEDGGEKKIKDVLSAKKDETLNELMDCYSSLKKFKNHVIQIVDNINEHFRTNFILSNILVYKCLSSELNNEDFDDIYNYFMKNSSKRLFSFLINESAYGEYMGEWSNDQLIFLDDNERMVGWVELVDYKDDGVFTIIRPVKDIFYGEKLFAGKFILSLIYIFIYKNKNIYNKKFNRIRTFAPVVGGMEKYKKDEINIDGFIINDCGSSEIIIDSFMSFLNKLTIIDDNLV